MTGEVVEQGEGVVAGDAEDVGDTELGEAVRQMVGDGVTAHAAEPAILAP